MHRDVVAHQECNHCTLGRMLGPKGPSTLLQKSLDVVFCGDHRARDHGAGHGAARRQRHKRRAGCARAQNILKGEKERNGSANSNDAQSLSIFQHHKHYVWLWDTTCATS